MSWKIVCGFLVYMHVIVLSRQDGCSETVYLRRGQRDVFYFSPNYPQRYSGSDCNYTFVAPMDFQVFAQCSVELCEQSVRIGGDQNSTSNCSSAFYISRRGDLSLGDAEKLCQSSELNLTSTFRSIAFGFNASTPARFLCKMAVRKQPCECGWSQNITSAIGTNITTGLFPSFVAIYNFGSQRIVCGGTIISHWLVLTARHCLDSPRQLAIIAGYTGLFEGNTELIKVRQEYVPIDGSDLAVLRTLEPLNWSKTVGPACLPFIQESDNFTLTDLEAIAVGWGVAGNDSNASIVVKHTLVNITSETKCKETYPDILITRSQFCTHAVGNSSHKFVSGGPVMAGTKRQYVLGVISSEPDLGSGSTINVNILPFVNVLDDLSHRGLCCMPFNRTTLEV